MAQTSVERRNMWAGRIERCLDSGMAVKRWCELNHVSKSSLYNWMARFREEEPGRFPRRNAATTDWLEITRGGLADARAIVPAASGAPQVESAAAPAAESNGRPLRDGEAADCPQAGGQPICAIANGVRILVPPGSAEPDVACVLRAAMSL